MDGSKREEKLPFRSKFSRILPLSRQSKVDQIAGKKRALSGGHSNNQSANGGNTGARAADDAVNTLWDKAWTGLKAKDSEAKYVSVLYYIRDQDTDESQLAV